MSLPVKDNLLSRYSSQDHWLPTLDILKELTKVANLSITSSLYEKEALFEHFLNTIYCGYFDELKGGLILDKSLSLLNLKSNRIDKCSSITYNKPISINLSLCRLLLASDHVFYHGEFRLVANKILLNLSSSVTNSKNKKLDHENYFDINNFHCSFDAKTLESILTGREIELFKSLSANKLISEQLIYTKVRSLKEASSIINMDYREAQIVEYSINEKLVKHASNLCKAKTLSTNSLIKNFQINCEFIEVISESLSSSENVVQRDLVEKLFTTLETELNESDRALSIYDKDSLNLICAGISLLTINFSQSLLNRIFNLIRKNITINKNTNSLLDIDEKRIYQNNFIIAFLKSLPTQFDIPELLLNFELKQPPSNISFNVVFIDKNSIECNQQITFLNSKYNAFQKIFIY